MLSVQPKVSIILLNYNGADDTLECLQSLFSVSYRHFNIIVVDNKSTDDSVLKIQRFLLNNGFSCSAKDDTYVSGALAIQLIQSEHNGGYGCGNNIGITSALADDADYVLILNNDTIVTSDFLEPLVVCCESDASVGIASCKILLHDQPDRIWFFGGKFHPITGAVEHFFFHELDRGQTMKERVSFISGCLWLIPSKTFAKVGLLNAEYFMYVEDLEFCQRVLNNGFRLDVSDKSKIYHKVGGSNGHWSLFSVYWMSRNKMRFLWDTLPPLKRLCPMTYQALFMSIKWLYKRRIDLFYAHVKGIFHFLRF
ncbi:glycosyltransferase family 2 protein [Shewanella abyssi]|uniref:glycosyltransferase family 2 protein n=1 Tax=Shewanella abyssi TaxID=311789 RepID=UPI00200ECF1D|nr:glycosyltransferase family 2 protein [Shewanella abyssi]MCL1049564.1 glycosyltransferase family 2 protein [Shewanella abyssi]